MPGDAIKRADELGKKQGAKAHLEFKNCCKEAITDDADDKESDSDSDRNDDSSVHSSSTAGVTDDKTAGLKLSDDESSSDDDDSVIMSSECDSNGDMETNSITSNESAASRSLHQKKRELKKLLQDSVKNNSFVDLTSDSIYPPLPTMAKAKIKTTAATKLTGHNPQES